MISQEVTERTEIVHPLFQKANGLTESIIGAAIEVHKDKGPGLVESIYEWCLLRELELRQLSTESQRTVRITYKGFVREDSLRFDVLVEDCVLVEAKATESILPIHKAQLLSCMKLLDVPVGLLINFYSLWVQYPGACSGLVVAGLAEAGPGSATPATVGD